MEHLSDQDLRQCVTAANARHHSASSHLIYNIDQLFASQQYQIANMLLVVPFNQVEYYHE